MSHDHDKAHELKHFAKPDEVRDFPKGRVELLTIGGATIGRAIFEPGWRWATLSYVLPWIRLVIRSNPAPTSPTPPRLAWRGPRPGGRRPGCRAAARSGRCRPGR